MKCKTEDVTKRRKQLIKPLSCFLGNEGKVWIFWYWVSSLKKNRWRKYSAFFHLFLISIVYLHEVVQHYSPKWFTLFSPIAIIVENFVFTPTLKIPNLQQDRTPKKFFFIKKNFYRKQVNVLDISQTPTNGRSLVHYNPIALCL